MSPQKDPETQSPVCSWPQDHIGLFNRKNNVWMWIRSILLEPPPCHGFSHAGPCSIYELAVYVKVRFHRRWFSVLSVLKVAFHTQTIKYEMHYEKSRMGLSPLLTLAENTMPAGTGPKQLLTHSKDRCLCVWRTEAS